MFKKFLSFLLIIGLYSTIQASIKNSGDITVKRIRSIRPCYADFIIETKPHADIELWQCTRKWEKKEKKPMDEYRASSTGNLTTAAYDFPDNKFYYIKFIAKLNNKIIGESKCRFSIACRRNY